MQYIQYLLLEWGSSISTIHTQNRVASGFASLGYDFKQALLLKTTSVDSLTIPCFTQAFSQAQGDDSGILA